MMIERIPITSREQWLAVRRHDVTASTIGALYGAHPYMSALKLYMTHAGIEFPKKENEAMKRGRLLEPAVGLAVAEERPDWQIVKANEYYRDPGQRLGATPDFYIDGDPRGRGVLQAKTASPHAWEHYWDEGREVPLWIELQCLTECMLTDAAFGVVAVLRVDAFGLDCSITEIPRHSAAEQKIRAAVAQFWRDVAAGHEPQPDYGRDADLLKIIAPREIKGKIIDLSGDNELPALLSQRELLMQEIEGYKTRKTAIDTEIKFKLGDAERGVGIPEWSIIWRTHHVNEYVVAATDQRPLRIHHKKEARP
jgi:predicted phage-related endonuclease